MASVYQIEFGECIFLINRSFSTFFLVTKQATIMSFSPFSHEAAADLLSDGVVFKCHGGMSFMTAQDVHLQ